MSAGLRPGGLSLAIRRIAANLLNACMTVRCRENELSPTVAARLRPSYPICRSSRRECPIGFHAEGDDRETKRRGHRLAWMDALQRVWPWLPRFRALRPIGLAAMFSTRPRAES